MRRSDPGTWAAFDAELQAPGAVVVRGNHPHLSPLPEGEEARSIALGNLPFDGLRANVESEATFVVSPSNHGPGERLLVQSSLRERRQDGAPLTHSTTIKRMRHGVVGVQRDASRRIWGRKGGRTVVPPKAWG